MMHIKFLMFTEIAITHIAIKNATRAKYQTTLLFSLGFKIDYFFPCGMQKIPETK